MKYEDLVKHLLEVFGLGIIDTWIMEEEKVLSQWDAYDTQHLGPPTQFDVTMMDRYTYLITQCQEAAKTIGELEKKRENAKEILKKV